MHAFSTGIFYFIFMTYLKSFTERYSYWAVVSDLKVEFNFQV